MRQTSIITLGVNNRIHTYWVALAYIYSDEFSVPVVGKLNLKRNGCHNLVAVCIWIDLEQFKVIGIAALYRGNHLFCDIGDIVVCPIVVPHVLDVWESDERQVNTRVAVIDYHSEGLVSRINYLTVVNESTT